MALASLRTLPSLLPLSALLTLLRPMRPRLTLALRSVFMARRLRHRLLVSSDRWLRLGRLLLALDRRDRDGSRPLHACASPLPRLRARDGRSNLPWRRWRVGTLARLPLVLPRLRLRALPLILLSSYRVLRLIPILLPLQRLLLLHPGIAIP